MKHHETLICQNSIKFNENENIKKHEISIGEYLIDSINNDGRLDIDLEFEDFSKDVFDEAIHRIMSSDLLRECFYNFICHNKGSEKYPINPYSSKNWSKQDNIDFKKFDSDKKFLV